MIFDRIEWDEHNLDHATRRLTFAEIEQVVANAKRLQLSRRNSRGRIEAVTDGGKRAVVIVEIVADGVRPITAWEA